MLKLDLQSQIQREKEEESDLTRLTTWSPVTSGSSGRETASFCSRSWNAGLLSLVSVRGDHATCSRSEVLLPDQCCPWHRPKGDLGMASCQSTSGPRSRVIRMFVSHVVPSCAYGPHSTLVQTSSKATLSFILRYPPSFLLLHLIPSSKQVVCACVLSCFRVVSDSSNHYGL